MTDAKPETPRDCNAHMSPAVALAHGLRMAIEGLMLALPHVKIKDAKEAHGLLSGANNLIAILKHHEPLAIAAEKENAALRSALESAERVFRQPPNPEAEIAELAKMRACLAAISQTEG